MLITPRAATSETFSTVRGRIVVAEDGSVLPGAEITISGGALPRGRTVTTNSRGRFVFVAIPPGRHYRLSVNAVGFYRVSGDIGDVAASETVWAETAIHVSNPSGCSVTWWSVDRRGSTEVFVFPLPEGPRRGICL
jgi:hypothetical protein